MDYWVLTVLVLSECGGLTSMLLTTSCRPTKTLSTTPGTPWWWSTLSTTPGPPTTTPTEAPEVLGPGIPCPPAPIQIDIKEPTECVNVGPLCEGRVMEITGTHCNTGGPRVFKLKLETESGDSPFSLEVDIQDSYWHDMKMYSKICGVVGNTKTLMSYIRESTFTIGLALVGRDIQIWTAQPDYCNGVYTISDQFDQDEAYTLCVEDVCGVVDTLDIMQGHRTSQDTTVCQRNEDGSSLSHTDGFAGGLLGGYDDDDDDDDDDTPDVNEYLSDDLPEEEHERLQWANVTVSDLTPAVILTCVGLGSSILCLAITICTQVYSGKVQKTPGKLMVSLAASLASAQFIFLFLDFPFGSNLVCRIVAIAEHFFWLMAFSWSNAVVGDLLRVLSANSPTQHRSKSNNYLFYSVISSILPIAIVVTCTLLDHFTEFYEYGRPGSCWIYPDDARWYSFIVPIATSVSINIILLILVFVVICKIRSSTRSLGQDAFLSNQRAAIIGLKLASIMGITWVFGILGDVLNNDILKFLFTLFNIFQGICVFLALTYNHKYVKRWVRAKVCRSPTQPDVVTASITASTSAAHANQNRN